MVHRSKKPGSRARVGKITTPHGVIHTPAFVPVGTNGALKAVDERQSVEAEDAVLTLSLTLSPTSTSTLTLTLTLTLALALTLALNPNPNPDPNQAGTQLMFCNTYHLLVHPGPDIVRRGGGLHKFIGHAGPIITDSGGFQVCVRARVRVREAASRSV